MRKKALDVVSGSSNERADNAFEQEQDQLSTIKKLLETANFLEFTEVTISQLAIQLHKSIVEIRNTPDDTIEKCVISRDAMLANLLDASIELNLALDQLTLKGKTPRFYKYLLTFQEYLEKAFAQRVNGKNDRESSEEIGHSYRIGVNSPVKLSIGTFLKRTSNHKEDLIEAQESLYYIYKLFRDEDDIFADHCDRAIAVLRSISEPIRKLCGLLDGCVHLPSDIATLGYELMVTLYHADEQSRKLASLMASYRPRCQSKSKQAVKMREEAYCKLDLFIHSLDDILQRMTLLLDQTRFVKESIGNIRRIPLGV